MSRKQPRCRVCHLPEIGIDHDLNHVECLTDDQLDVNVTYWETRTAKTFAKGDIPLPQTGQGAAAREEKAARYRRSVWMCSTRASTRKRERIPAAGGVRGAAVWTLMEVMVHTAAESHGEHL